MLNIEIATRTEVGARAHNEDDLRFGASGPLWHAVLADGAGGHQGGATASDLVVRLVARAMQAAPAASSEALDAALHEAHAALGERQQGGARARMHATVVALWIDAEHQEAVWSHVGDSRLYMLRRGRVCHVTRDDSVVQQLLDAGYISADEAREHPRKNQLIAAMGTDEPVQPHTVDEPQPVRDGDAFLLASDGWWDALDDEAIETTFAAARSAEEWLVLMEQRVPALQRPDQDNYSALAVWVGDPAETTRYEVD